jgi:plastocyanin domain-containing protein
MRVATVIGHTHPGTGLIAVTESFIFSKSVSQQAIPSTNVQPTSITIDFGVTISRVRSPGFPAATMMISAF